MECCKNHPIAPAAFLNIGMCGTGAGIFGASLAIKVGITAAGAIGLTGAVFAAPFLTAGILMCAVYALTSTEFQNNSMWIIHTINAALLAVCVVAAIVAGVLLGILTAGLAFNLAVWGLLVVIIFACAAMGDVHFCHPPKA